MNMYMYIYLEVYEGRKEDHTKSTGVGISNKAPN